MINVILIGPAEDRRLHSFLEKTLGSINPILSLSSKGFISNPNPMFLLWDCGHISNIDSTNLILIVKQNCGTIPSLQIKPECKPIIIVPSECKEALQFALKCNCPTVTCGLGSKDTITLSSFVENQAVVAIQRSIHSITGTVIEPVEIPLNISKATDSYGLLILAALLAYTSQLEKFIDIIL